MIQHITVIIRFMQICIFDTIEKCDTLFQKKKIYQL